MAIEKIILRNFQIHRKTTLNIHEGINIIAGSSDNGKSSIIRAIRWLCENSPRGFKFRRWNAPEKSVTSVIMEVDGSVIERKRGAVSNCYCFDGVTYTALKSDVPEVVRELLEITPYNIQRQLEGPFLFSKSSTEVAKMINEVAGIAVINDIIKESNKRYREAKHKVSFLSDMAKSKKSLMHAHKLFLPLKKKATYLEEQARKLVELDSSISSMEESIAQIRNARKVLKRLKPKLAAANKVYEVMISCKKDLDDFDSSGKIERLRSLISDIQECSSFEVMPDREKNRISKVLRISSKKNDRVATLNRNIRSIVSAIKTIQGQDRHLKTIISEKGKTQKKLDAVKEEAGFCPVCGTTFGENDD